MQVRPQHSLLPAAQQLLAQGSPSVVVSGADLAVQAQLLHPLQQPHQPQHRLLEALGLPAQQQQHQRPPPRLLSVLARQPALLLQAPALALGSTLQHQQPAQQQRLRQRLQQHQLAEGSTLGVLQGLQVQALHLLQQARHQPLPALVASALAGQAQEQQAQQGPPLHPLAWPRRPLQQQQQDPEQLQQQQLLPPARADSTLVVLEHRQQQQDRQRRQLRGHLVPWCWAGRQQLQAALLLLVLGAQLLQERGLLLRSSHPTCWQARPWKTSSWAGSRWGFAATWPYGCLSNCRKSPKP